MKKLIPLFLARFYCFAISLQAMLWRQMKQPPKSGRFRPELHPQPHTKPICSFLTEGVDPQAADLFTRHDITFSSHGPNAARVTVNLETADNVKKLGFTKLTFQYWNGSSWVELSSVHDEYINNSVILVISK